MSPKERAGSARDALLHLKKARSYYETAVQALENGHYDPAVSDSVISGINSADVICLVELGRRNDNNAHEAAVRLLNRAGGLGEQAAPILARMLPRKNLSQYRTALADQRDAEHAIADAEQLLDLATQAAARLP